MKLTIVGLPIGNVSDISERAIKVLSESKFIVCEDTRMFSNLWNKLVNLGKAPSLSGKIKYINDFNEFRALPSLLSEMDLLDEAVLVSDAGMPLISDPGYKLVHEGLKLGWDISVVPGPTAESAALSVSGLPTDKYLFLGFLPKKEGKRRDTFSKIKLMSEILKFSVVIYESPMRLYRVLTEIEEVWSGDLPICLAVDLTKISEKILRGSLNDVRQKVMDQKLKGEVTMVLSLSE